MKSYQIHKNEAGSKLKNQKRESAPDKKSKSLSADRQEFLLTIKYLSHE